MWLLYEVAKDLYFFATDSVGSLLSLFKVKEQSLSVPIKTQLIPFKVQDTHPMIRFVPRAKSIVEVKSIHAVPQKNTVVYVATADAPIRKTPTNSIDNVLVKAPYGAMLVALENENGWVRVFHHGVEGWMLIEDIADRAAYVYPRFIIGEANLSDDPNTERVRAVIADEFSYGERNTELQAEEYVLYKLYRRGAKINWSDVRPRTPGTWGTLLRDAEGILMLSEPKQRAVMEWMISETLGHLAYVEAVFPDGSIQISEANWPDQGIYNERVLVRDEWQALKPAFILVT